MAFVLFQPVAEVLDGKRFAFRGDSLLNGDDMHADACASGRHHLGDTCQGQICHALKEVGSLGIHIRLLRVYHHDLSTARDEHIQYPALLVVRVFAVEIFPVELNKTALADGLHGLLKVFSVKLRVLCGQLFDGQRHALFHGQADVEYIIGHLLVILVCGVLQCGIDAKVFRGFGCDLVLAEKDSGTVGDHFAELGNLLVFCHSLQPPDFFNADTLALVNLISTLNCIVTFLFKIVNKHTDNLTNLTKQMQKI